MSIDTSTGRECKGSPETVIEGGSETKSFVYPDTITIDGNSFHVCYRNASDDSATILSGALSGNGTNTLTLKTIANEVGGNTYIHTFAVTCQGQRVVYFFRRVVLKKSGR
jgi:hypothetical protein